MRRNLRRFQLGLRFPRRFRGQFESPPLRSTFLAIDASCRTRSFSTGEQSMKRAVLLTLAFSSLGTIALAQGLDSFYKLGPDSLEQEGVPHGKMVGPSTLPCKVYPGTSHTYWVYVPAQYDPAKPASLMIFNDGQAFKNEKGDARAQNVMDNLIHRREIPVMIGVFINPGERPNSRNRRPRSGAIARPIAPPSTTRRTTNMPG